MDDKDSSSLQPAAAQTTTRDASSFSFTSLHRGQHAHEEGSQEEEGYNTPAHAQKLLQSTPNAKGRGGRSGPHAAHRRVSRNITGSGGSSSRRRSFEPVSSSNTETETELETSEAESDSRQGGDEGDFDRRSRPAEGDTARKPYPVREYWNNLVLDVEGSRGAVDSMSNAHERSKPSTREGPLSTRDSARLSGLLLRPGNGASTNTPSIGSSTLVDQESVQGGHHTAAGDAKPPAPIASPSPSLQDHYARLEDQYERPVSAPPTSTPARTNPSGQPRRTSPLQDHIARFAPSSSFASSAYLDVAETSQESRPRDASGSWQDLEQERSRSSLADRAAGDSSSSTTTPQASLAASRVHDIFAKHIHNVSASLALSGRSSIGRSTTDANSNSGVAAGRTSAFSGSFLRGGGTLDDGMPRHRLRDLLASTADTSADRGLASSSRDIAKLPTRSPQRHRRKDSHISPQSRRSLTHSASPLRPSSTAASSPSHSRRSTPAKSVSLSTHPIHPSPSPRRSSHHASPSRQQSHAQRYSSGQQTFQSFEASREHQVTAATPAANRLSREWQDVVARNAALTAAARAAQDQEQQGAGSEAGLETDQTDGEERDSESDLAAVDEYGQRGEDVQGAGSEEDSFSPDLRDYEEEEQLTDIQEPEASAYGDDRGDADDEHGEAFQGGSTQHEASTNQSEQTASQSHLFLAERRSSPAKASLRQSRVNSTNSRPLESSDTPERVGTLQFRRTTPPKTPHLPGFYHSSTPYQVSPTPAFQARQMAQGHAFSLQTPLPAQSRTVGEPSLLLSVYGAHTPAPRVPGAYSSPFPHPKRAEASPASGSSILQASVEQRERHNLHASTRLEQIIEGEEVATEQSERAASPARVKRTSPAPKSTTPKGTPTRARRSPLGTSRASPATQPPPSPSSGRQSSPLQRVKARQNETSNTSLDEGSTAVTPQPSPAKRARSESTESVMHSLLSELAKPLGYLLGTSVAPLPVDAHGAGPTTPADDVASGLTPTKLAYRDALTEKGSRKLEQDAILQRLADAERLDQSLASRIEEIRREVNEIGSRLTSQVGTVLSESFALESRRRRGWLALALILEVLVVWVIFTLANARANLAHQTTYFDPFFPALYAEGETAYRVSSALRYSSLSASSFSTASSASSSFLSTFFDATRFTNAVSLPASLAYWPTWLCIYALAAKEHLASIWFRLLSPVDFLHGTHLTQATGADVLSASGSLARAAGYRIPT